MLTPSYLDHVPDALTRLYEQAEEDILKDMASRINAADLYIPATQWQERKLQELGLCHDEIVTRLSAISGKSNKEIERLITNAGAEALSLDGDFYAAAGVSAGAIFSAPFVKATIKAGIAKTKGTFRNLTRTTANTATKQFENALDRAYMQVNSGAFSTEQAVQMAIKDLSRSGVGSIVYPTGHTDNIEVAVRRATITGVNQTAAKLSEELADELGCDLVEVTAHHGARPTHAEWQGQVYSRSGKTPGYDNFADATGYGTGEGLCGWNCRHSFYPYYEGTSHAYSKKLLDEYENKTVTYNGRTLSEYEATQQQRYIERQVRRWKREYQAMSAAGQPTGQAAAKISEWNARQADFLKQTGLKAQVGRTAIPGFGRSQAQQAAAQARAAKNAVQTTAAKGTIKAETLGKYLSKAHTDAITSIMEKAPVAMRELWNALESEIKVINSQFKGGAHYSPLGRGINVNIDNDANGRSWSPPYETTLHEFGHLFDYAANARAGGSAMRALSEVYDSGALGLKLKEEAAEHVKTAWDKLKAEAVKNGLPASSVKKASAYAAVSKELKAMSGLAGSDISDIFEGATRAKAAGNFGHGVTYWKNRDNGKEAFAEMFSATSVNPASLEKIKDYFPKSYKIFEEIVGTILKGGA